MFRPTTTLICLIILLTINPIVWAGRKIFKFRQNNHTLIAHGPDKECAKRNVVYPPMTGAQVNVPQNVQSIVMPFFGALILLNDQPIVLKTFDDTDHCDASTFSNYMAVDLYSYPWFSIQSWTDEEWPEWNKAMVHMDKIPCECDTVEFPQNKSFFVLLKGIADTITVDKIMINGEYGDFPEFFKTEMASHLFLFMDEVNFERGKCKPKAYCGCHGFNTFWKYFDELCYFERRFCEIPHCMNPIHPIGHCCPICGATVEIPIANSCDFDMREFKANVQRRRKTISNGYYMNLIDFHVSIFPHERNNADSVVQLVVVDLNEYNGYSTEFVNLFEQSPGVFKSMYHHLFFFFEIII